MLILRHELKKLRKVTLPLDSKIGMRNQLATFMQSHPVRVEDTGRLFPQTLNHSFIMPVLVIVIAAMLGGGTAFAAQQSLPGDALYPVKIYINEEVRASLTLNDEARANYALDLAERRVDEAVRAEAKGRLSAEAHTQLERQIAAKTQQTHEVAKKLEAHGNVRAAETIRARLDAYLDAKSIVLGNLGMTIVSDSSAETSETTDAKTEVKLQGLLRAVQEENRNLLEDLKTRFSGNAELNANVVTETEIQAPEPDETQKITESENSARVESEVRVETETELNEDEKMKEDVKLKTIMEASVNL